MPLGVTKPTYAVIHFLGGSLAYVLCNISPYPVFDACAEHVKPHFRESLKVAGSLSARLHRSAPTHATCESEECRCRPTRIRAQLRQRTSKACQTMQEDTGPSILAQSVPSSHLSLQTIVCCSTLCCSILS